MAIPNPHTTSEQVKAELGLGTNWSSEDVKAAAGLGTNWSSEDLDGFSAFEVQGVGTTDGLATANSDIASAQLTLVVRTDGTSDFTGYQNVSGGKTDWGTAVQAGIGAAYQVQVVRTSGIALSGSAEGSWLDINVNRSWAVSAYASQGTVTRITQVTCLFRKKGTTTVLASHSFQMAAQATGNGGIDPL